MGIKATYKYLDKAVKTLMKKWAVPFLRGSFALIFIWFGILKPLRLSPAEAVLLITVKWLPVYEPEQWLYIIGWWEVAIGVTFLFKKTTKIAIALLFLQMAGTFMPLFLLPEVTFQDGKIYQPTLEGQYIIKNLMIIGAALVIGGTTYNYRLKS
jgi:uncharacterized membrane protein YkgB